MTCPRCAFGALLFYLLAFLGCDSNNPGGDVSEFEGTYIFATYLFSRPGDDAPVDVIELLDPGYENELEINGSGSAFIRYRRVDAAGSRTAELTADASGGVLVLTPATNEDAEHLFRELLFPPNGSLHLSASGEVLTATHENLTVNLHEFDPEAFPSEQNSGQVEGTLTVAFTKE